MLKSSLSVSFVCSLCLLSACDSSDTSGDSAKGPSVEKLIESAEGLMEEAKKAGAEEFAAQQFETAAKYLADAKSLVEEGKADKAKTKAKSAERNFKTLVTQGAEVKKARTAALAAKKKAEKSIEEMKKKKWDVGAASEVEEIDKVMAQCQADLDSGEVMKLNTIPRRYERVAELVKRAREETQQSAVALQKADANKKAAMEAEGKAKEAKAEKLAPEDLSRAQQLLREAEIEYKNSHFQEASDLYVRAETAYQDAANRARQEEQLIAGIPPLAEPVAKAPDPKKSPSPPEEPTPVPTPEEVKPGELSAEDEIFLERNIAKFSSNSNIVPEYDAATGEVTVEYSWGDHMKKDLLLPRGMAPKHLEYRDPYTLGVDWKNLERKKESSFTFGANTDGFFLFPVPFKDKVSLEYYVEIGLVSPSGGTGPVLMSSESGRSFIWANFATVDVWSEGKRTASLPPPDKKFQKNPNVWFTKVLMGMKITYEVTDDPKKAKVSIFYDTDNEDEPINVQTVPARSGFVGFSWTPVKFKVRQLKIAGKLDKEAAVKFLKKKLGLAEGAAAGKGAGGKAPAPKSSPPPKGGPKSEKAVSPPKEKDGGEKSSASTGGQKSEKKPAKTKEEEDADF